MKSFRALPLAAAIAAAFAMSSPAMAQSSWSVAQPNTTDARGTAARLNATDRTFVTRATEANVKEIALSKMALDHSQNGAIQDVARKMIHDHTVAGHKLAAIVNDQNLSAPTEAQAASKAAAEGKSYNQLFGDAFDRRYASTVVSDHVSTIELFENEAHSGTDPQLKQFADDALPILRNHLEMARALEPQLSGRANNPGATTATAGTTSVATTALTRNDTQRAEESRDASTHVSKALETLRQMQRDPQVKATLARALGVFVIPDYGRAALGVGAQGGAGVLMVKHNGTWSGPGFYNFGGISIGAWAGASAGQIAMMSMDQKAVDSFAQGNKFSLNADAGLTIVNFSERAHGAAGRGDVIVWSDTEGAFANRSLSITDVNFDEKETAAYYGRTVSAASIVNGAATSSHASTLAAALPK